MKAVMVADLHLVDRADPVQERFVHWLDRLDADMLVVLGDLFHHWWGFRDAIQSRYVPACDALLRARRRGLRLVYVPGNHDFALGPFFRDTLGAEICGPHVRVLDGVRCWLAHGDEADWSSSYLLARSVVRGRPFAAVMRLLGPARGDRLVARLAGASRDHPAVLDHLVEVQLSWARRQLREGADIAVIGHLHRPAHLVLPEGEVVRLGDWQRGPTWFEASPGGRRLLRERPDGEVEVLSPTARRG